LFDIFNYLGKFDNIIGSGDLNAQYIEWGSTRNNFVGITFNEFLSHSPYIILNDGSGTRVLANMEQESWPTSTTLVALT